VSFSVLSVCICVLYYCHLVATQLQLHISYHISNLGISTSWNPQGLSRLALHLPLPLHISSVVRQMPGKKPQRRGKARTLSKSCVGIFCVVLCIVCFVSFSVLFLCVCVLYYCHRVATQLQLNISYRITYHIWDSQPLGTLWASRGLLYLYLYTFSQL
jgi:hypothetical protein